VREPVNPRLRTEGPQFRIAENEHKEPSQKKTYRPCITNIWPWRTQPRLRKNKNPRQHHKKPSQVMIEFALAFVRGQFFRSTHGRHRVWCRRTHVHSGHIVAHSTLALVACLRGMILRAKQRLALAKYQSKQQAYAYKFKLPEQILAEIHWFSKSFPSYSPKL